MDILTLIKRRATVRKYQRRPIPKRILNKIIEAGIWGPSVPSFLRIQPWKFVVVTNKKTRAGLAKLIYAKARKSGVGVNILLSGAAKAIEGAAAVVVVYNSGEMGRLKSRYKELYLQFHEIILAAQLSAISAAIQNMVLVAESLGIGSCWLDTPLFCEKEISGLLGAKEDMVAILTLGYPAEQGRRSPRKPTNDAVDYKK